MAARVQLRTKAVYHRGTVACQKCAAPIYVYKVAALPDEFSLRCSRCGERGHYSKRGVAVQELPDRRKKPRK